MYIPRTLETAAMEVSAGFPVLPPTGARGAGKTTLPRRLAGGGRLCLNLEGPKTRKKAPNDPGLFMRGITGPVLTDEIQRAPQLPPCIKVAADNSQKPGEFWLTWSQQFHLAQNVSESLAGRVVTPRLMGLSRREEASPGAVRPAFLPDP